MGSRALPYHVTVPYAKRYFLVHIYGNLRIFYKNVTSFVVSTIILVLIIVIWHEC